MTDKTPSFPSPLEIQAARGVTPKQAADKRDAAKKAKKAKAKPKAKASGYHVKQDFFIRDGVAGTKGDHIAKKDIPEADAAALKKSGHIA